jgi:hypothetical protein
LGKALAGRSCDAVSPQPASDERFTQIDTPAEGTLREGFEATGRADPAAVPARRRQ